jgi:hypothetical protein
MVPLTAAAAQADPPGNDKPDGAVALSLGQTYKEDTSQATTDKIDQKANRACGAPFTNASVWFTYTASEDGAFLLDMSQSDYSGGFMVFIGKPTAGDMIACGPTELGIEASSGTKFLIVAFSDTKKNGGNLVLSLEEGPPPPTMKVTIDPTGKVMPKGKAYVSGTITCTNAVFVELDGQLRQLWERVKINGYFSKIINGDLCDGQSHPWSRVVTSHNGIYAAGDATMRISAFGCGPIECADSFVRGHVMLSKGKAAPQGHQVSSAHTIVTTYTPVASRHWPAS